MERIEVEHGDYSHAIDAEQQDNVAAFSRRLIKEQSLSEEDEEKDLTRDDCLVDTLCTLWPIPIAFPLAARRIKLSSIHDMLYEFSKHQARHISSFNSDFKRKKCPDLQQSFRALINKMYLSHQERIPSGSRKDYLLLHISTKFEDMHLAGKINLVMHLLSEAI